MGEALKEEVDNEEVTVSPSEAKARKNGWFPQDEWKGNPEDWVDHGVFNARGEMIGRITEQSSIIAHLTNKVDEREKALEDMQKLQSTIADREFKRAMETLKKQKAIAVEDGDGEKVVELDDEIAELRDRKADMETKPAPTQDGVPPELTAWLANPDNSWYASNQMLKNIADGIAVTIRQENPNIQAGDLLKQMEEKIKAELPQHFKSKTEKVVVDDGGGDVVNRQRADDTNRSYSQLSDDEKAACDRFVKLKLMTRKEYIEALDGGGADYAS